MKELARRVVESLFIYAVVLVVFPALMALFAAPGIGVILACVRWVLSVPGGLSWYPTAFGGLFLGVYLVPISIVSGTFARRLSSRVARLSPIPVAEAAPSQFVAIDAWVVGGRPVHASNATMPTGPTPDEWVAYPLVLQDTNGDVLRVERSDGENTPPDPLAFGRVRVGHRVVAVGEILRDEASAALYRVPARGARLVRGKAPWFGVLEGDVVSLVAELRRGETSPAWGIGGLAALALGLASMIGAQSAAPPWFP